MGTKRTSPFSLLVPTTERPATSIQSLGSETAGKILLIGQAPGPNSDPHLPLYPIPKTSTGGRLVAMMGLSRGEYLRRFQRTNLLLNFPGSNMNGDKFPLSEARIAANALRPLLGGRKVVMVGRNVSEAFGLTIEFHNPHFWQVGHHLAREPGICEVAVVPHPSGRNHWYNSRENQEEAREFWRHFLTK